MSVTGGPSCAAVDCHRVLDVFRLALDHREGLKTSRVEPGRPSRARNMAVEIRGELVWAESVRWKGGK